MTPSWIMAPLALVSLPMGSFFGVVVSRVPRGISIIRPGSHCLSCGHAVAPYDNIPVISWLLLRGRCRYCAASIGSGCIVIELVTAVILTSASALPIGGPKVGPVLSWSIAASFACATCLMVARHGAYGEEKR